MYPVWEDRMATYKCDYALRRAGKPAVYCLKLEQERGDGVMMPCAFQKYCAKRMMCILTAQSVGCLRRKEREETTNEQGSEGL